MSRQKLSIRNLLLVGFTLFSMFFGAGNLIFPPFLGAQAGTASWKAMAGFLVSAACLPILGVAAVALSDGIEKLCGRVGPRFASIFPLLVYLFIGPCLAIPRTASTSFEMTVLPAAGALGIDLEGSFLGIEGSFAAQAGYSALFFCIAVLLSLRPDRLTERLGKVLCPTLLILIAVIFTGCLVWPAGTPAGPEASYQAAPALTGFLAGYDTMDTLAALNFGIIIAMNVRAKGVTQDGSVVRETIKAGAVAGLLLALVYSALAYVGAPVGRLAGEGANGARILTYVAGSLFGSAGLAILGFIFFIACLNTCVGLLCCCSQYFSTRFSRLGYKAWMGVFAIASLFISSAGLDAILKISEPVLHAIYPVAIVLIVLSFLSGLIGRDGKVYLWTVSFTAVVSIIYGAQKAGLAFPGAWLAGWLPGYEAGFGWVLPAAAGAAAGVIVPRCLNGFRKKEDDGKHGQ